MNDPNSRASEILRLPSRRRFLAAAAAAGCPCGLWAADDAAWKAAGRVGIPHAVIRMRSPNSALFGITPDETVEITFAEVLKVHGYCAGGAAFAFRMAQEAFRALYGERLPVRQGIQVKTSHHCCQAMALAYITGARGEFGAFRQQGDITLLPEAEKKTIFIDKPTGKSVTLHMHLNPHETFEPLFQKTMKDPKYAPEVQRALNEKIAEYFSAPAERLFDIQR
ncbi:MAG: hypothetical protein JXP48_09835 [Acidobacteria bacterium]|nr:hypothetical protein [Acidobacteriota bacterium]